MWPKYDCYIEVWVFPWTRVTCEDNLPSISVYWTVLRLGDKKFPFKIRGAPDFKTWRTFTLRISNNQKFRTRRRRNHYRDSRNLNRKRSPLKRNGTITPFGNSRRQNELPSLISQKIRLTHRKHQSIFLWIWRRKKKTILINWANYLKKNQNRNWKLRVELPVLDLKIHALSMELMELNCWSKLEWSEYSFSVASSNPNGNSLSWEAFGLSIAENLLL